MKKSITKFGVTAQAIGIYVGLLVSLALLGAKSESRMRVVVLGELGVARWVRSCDCWLGRVRSFGTPDVDVRFEGTAEPPHENWLILFGRSDRANRRLVEIEHHWRMPQVRPEPGAVVAWLRSSRLTSLILLVLLLVYRWRTITTLQTLLTAIAAVAVVTLVLDHGVLWLGIGFPDASWILTLTTAACVGCHLASQIDHVLQGKARCLAAGCVAAVLFGDVGGAFGTLFGFAVPMLSQRAAFAFIVVLCASSALALSPVVDLAAASVSLVVAVADRFRAMKQVPVA